MEAATKYGKCIQVKEQEQEKQSIANTEKPFTTFSELNRFLSDLWM